MSQNDIESYEDIFTFLDGSVDDWTRFSETWFKDKLSKIDDIDKYKVDMDEYVGRGELRLNEENGLTPLYFALWLISENADAGLGIYPDVDKWVKLLVLKGSNVRYTYNRVSVLDFFQRLKRFYTEDEEEYEYFIGDLTPSDVREKLKNIEDYLTGKSAKKIQSRFRGNKSRLTSKAEGRITKKQLESDWIHLKRQMQASGFKPGEIEKFHRDHYMASLKKKKRTKRRRSSKKKKKSKNRKRK